MGHDSRKRRPSRIWHRWLGFLLVVPLLFITLTGLVLNHAEDLGWNQKPIRASWILSHYGMTLDGEPLTYLAGTNQVSEWDGQIFWNGRDLETQGPLLGAVALTAGAALVTTQAVHLHNADGDLLESLDEASLPEGAIARVGLSSDNQLVLGMADNRSWIFSEDLLDFRQADHSPVTWSAEAPTSISLRQRMESNYQGEGIPWSRFVHDLHSGVFFGFLGRLAVDVFGILVIILSVTGLIVGIRKLKQGSMAGYRHHGSKNGDEDSDLLDSDDDDDDTPDGEQQAA